MLITLPFQPSLLRLSLAYFMRYKEAKSIKIETEFYIHFASFDIFITFSVFIYVSKR